MGTIVRGQLGVWAAVMLVIAVVSATNLVGCGGGGGSSDGHLCEQCGETDGPCISPEVLPAADEDRPAFCTAGQDCTVNLRCVRKIDSAQRRCFPADPNNSNALDVDFECDGSRPEPLPSVTITPTPVPTETPLGPTLTPSATAVTPTPTGATPTPTPEPTATAEAEETVVSITVELESGDDFTTGFTATVTYPAAKGTFLANGLVDCDTFDALTFTDNGSGTLTLAFGGDPDGVSSVDADCTFHQKAGQSFDIEELSGSVTNGLTINFS